MCYNESQALFMMFSKRTEGLPWLWHKSRLIDARYPLHGVMGCMKNCSDTLRKPPARDDALNGITNMLIDRLLFFMLNYDLYNEAEK